MPDQPLTREQAAALAVDNTFDAGWSARDAEVAQLRAACESLVEALKRSTACNASTDDYEGPAIAAAEAALKQTEPTT